MNGTPLPVGLPTKVSYALDGAGLDTLERVAAYGWEQLAALPGMNPVSLAGLREACAHMLQ